MKWAALAWTYTHTYQAVNVKDGMIWRHGMLCKLRLGFGLGLRLGPNSNTLP